MTIASSSAPVPVQKAQLRTALLDNRPHSSAGLTEQLIALSAVTSSRQIGCYAAKSDEPSTAEFLDWALASQVAIYTPSIHNTSLSWQKYLGQLKPGRFGIGISTGESISIGELDLVCIPAVAATRSGQRLGRGGGFFDREIDSVRRARRARGPVFAAIVFDSELLSSLPTEPHDESVDFVVTPTQTIRSISDLAN